MKHAIFLRGAIRTWNFNKEKNIDFFNKYYDNPDWYICLWDSDSTTLEALRQDFSNSNVKFLQLENENNYFKFDKILNSFYFSDKFCNTVPPYWRLSYLDNILSIAKRKYELENNIEYQTVTFARTDILYDSPYYTAKDYNNAMNAIKEMYIVFQSVDNTLSNPPAPPTENYFVNDMIITCGKIAGDIYGTRFIDVDYTDGPMAGYINWDMHQIMGRIQSRYQLFNTDPVSIRCKIIRPNMVIPDNLDKWENLSVEQKQFYCNKIGVDIRDYDIPIKV